MNDEITIKKNRLNDVDIEFVNQLKLAFPVGKENLVWILEKIKTFVSNTKKLIINLIKMV